LAKILVVDDEVKMTQLLKGFLGHRGHEVTAVTSGREALDRIGRATFDLVVTDLRMEPIDGMAVIDGIKSENLDTAVVVLTAYGEVKSAVEAMAKGAYSYLTKPCTFEEVALIIDKAIGEAALKRRNRALQHAVARLAGGRELVGSAPPMQTLKAVIAKVAPSEATVLVRGESGVGKELVAHSIHAASRRAEGPFVAVNCAAIPETLLESELFGYRKGAFTGADQDREGLFEAARGGTLFLDEIGEAGVAVQAKLLRVLAERKINRVGDPREREVDVRIVAATNRPLEAALETGGFREDLYYRLLVFPVDVPPLRDRLEDLEDLVARFLENFDRRQRGLPRATQNRMRAYDWPGNVRELKNVIERAHILAGEGQIGDEHIVLDVARPDPARGGGGAFARTGGAAGDLNLQNNERRLIVEALRRAGGNKSLAAQLLGITRRTLYSRLKLLGLGDEVRRSDGAGGGETT
jgi:DNA-binding NtrC family response regulator